MIDSSIMPRWAFVDGYYFSRDDLMRAKPRWWWMHGRLEAWRMFRQRLIAARREIEEGYVDPTYCWAELRMFVVNGERAALDAAIKLTTSAHRVNGLMAGVGLRYTEEALARIASHNHAH